MVIPLARIFRKPEFHKGIVGRPQRFLYTGPLLLWIEDIASFNEITAFSRANDDIMLWSRNQAYSLMLLSRFDLELLEGLWRDIARICREYTQMLSERPNSIHDLLFDLFPFSSPFFERFRTGTGFVSGGACLPLYLATMGVSNQYKIEYHLSFFSHGYRHLFALASTQNVRIVDQNFGNTVDIINPPPSTRTNRWAVLVMAFSSSHAGQPNMF